MIINTFLCCAFYLHVVSLIDMHFQKVGIIYVQTDSFSSKMERRCVMAFRLKPAQSYRVKALVHRRCCSCNDHHCLLHGDRKLHQELIK